MQAPVQPSIFDRRLLVVSGKGGVGRTTVAAALAFAAAAHGRKVLVAETQGQGRLSRLLGLPALGPDIVTVDDRIDAVNMTPLAALREYGLMALKIEALYKVIFENRPVRAFLAAVPGLYAYSMLGKAWFHTTETRADGRPRYDLVILDGPASGHAITMMKIPSAIVTAMPRGPLTRDAESIFSMLRDPVRSAFVVVTLAEELPAREALDLICTTRTALGAPLAPLIVNAVPDTSWAAPELLTALDATTDAGVPALETTLAAVRALSSRRREAEPILRRLMEKSGLPIVALPRLFSETLGPPEARALAQLLAPL